MRLFCDPPSEANLAPRSNAGSTTADFDCPSSTSILGRPQARAGAIAGASLAASPSIPTAEQIWPGVQ